MTVVPPQRQLQEDEYVFPYHYRDLADETYRELDAIDDLSYLRIVKSLAGPFNGQRLLDAGCGDGRFCYELRNEDVTVVGVDCSERALTFARAFNPNALFVRAELAGLPFHEEFDVATLVEVLEHIPPAGVAGVVENLARSLRPGGKLVVSAPTTNVSLSPKHYRHFTLDSLTAALAGHFELERVIGHSRGGKVRKRFRRRRRFVQGWRGLLEIIGLYSRAVRSVQRLYQDRIETCDPADARRLIACFRRRPGQP